MAQISADDVERGALPPTTKAKFQTRTKRVESGGNGEERPDTIQRVTSPGRNGGTLMPFQKGVPQTHDRRSVNVHETLLLARRASPEAMRTLIRNLSHDDGRIATMSAGMVLERAWGKVREAPPEQATEARIDLSKLKSAELAILMALVQSGRLQEAPVEETPPTEIEGTAETTT